MKTRKIALSTLLFFCAGAALFTLGKLVFSQIENHSRIPGGAEEEGEEEGSKQALINAYLNLSHRAAPGTDWRKIELQNAEDNEAYRLGNIAQKMAGSFAGGLVNGTWYERGNTNTAGRMSSFAYNAGSNVLYGLSDAGTLWKTSPPLGTWTLLNDGFQLASKVLAISPINGGGRDRIMMARDTQLVYTDNSGASLQVASGISYPVKWGANKVQNIISVHDSAHSVYAIVYGWNNSPWSAATWVYYSSDTGKSFSKIYTFPGASNLQFGCFNPYNQAELYMLGVWSSGPDTLYQLKNGNVLPIHATSAFSSTAVESSLTGLINGGKLQLYALIDNNEIFASSDTGASWSFVKTLPQDSWKLLSSSSKQSGRLFYGNVEAFRSSDGGVNFSKINNWGDYYGHESSKLHADIQAIDFFQDASGNEFCIVGTDGGAYYSNDYLATVTNMSLSGLNVNQLWDHITDPNNPSVIFSGMQDQGLCHTMAAGGTGLITQKQLISGDYGQLCISGSGGMLWAEYPGGWMTVYGPTLTAPNSIASWQMDGSQKSNAAWMLPTASLPGPDDDILIGGGNITGGAGSYLAKLSLRNGTISATQFPFDFRAASGTGTAGLSTLAVCPTDALLWFAATEDGSFFHSSNAGSSWQKTTAFTGPKPYWLYGSCIEPSRKDEGTVYFGGSGYSNPGVYVSHDTGRTFTAMSTGLPATLVNTLAATPGDSLIFAATDAGPYVFVTAQQQWYPLIQSNTPGCVWRTVEYLPSIRTVRFSTYGRGVWDFVLAPVSNPNSVASSSQQYSGLKVFPNPAKSGQTIHLDGLNFRTARFALYDLTGRRVAQWNQPGTEPLNLPNLPAGAYIYRVEQEGRAYSGKLNLE
ncbi:MAG: T9SS type A sorting domain-containing protein [Bacteroidetes bacterium]|nr:T9SS type A sorting domain-containing protein [Bacteroidota bacterium]MBS1629360.1 T9SS type A sorting domain-containing protein [Bacteroidota bacterium]